MRDYKTRTPDGCRELFGGKIVNSLKLRTDVLPGFTEAALRDAEKHGLPVIRQRGRRWYNIEQVLLWFQSHERVAPEIHPKRQPSVRNTSTPKSANRPVSPKPARHGG